jgi:hypothetical protein
VSEASTKAAIEQRTAEIAASLGPSISEEAVTEAAKVVRRTLTNLGYKEIPRG